MLGARACATCLATEARMHSMSGTGLLQAYQLLTSRQMVHGMPDYLCWECAALMNKFNIFRLKCQRSYQLLQDVFSAHNEISENDCKQFDRKAFNLTSTYGFSKLYNSDYVQLSQTFSSSDAFIEIPKSETDGFEFNDSMELVDVKSEVDFDTDNDVPLLYLNKEMKSSKRKKKELKRKSNQKKSSEDIVSTDNKEVKEQIVDSFGSHDVRVGIEIEVAVKEEVAQETESQLNVDSGKDQITKPLKNLKIDKSDKRKAMNTVRPNRNKLKPCSRLNVIKIGDQTANHKSGKDTAKKRKLVETKREPLNKKVDFKDFATAVMLTQEQQMDEIVRRQETASYREAAFKCTLCYKGFVNRNAYTNHTRKHDPATGEYQCDMCKSRFKKRYYVADHIYKVHMTKYVCKFCPFISQCVYQASTHYKWHKGVVYTCNICREEFTTKSTYLSHRRIKHATEHVCAACGESFVSRLGLLQHNSRLHKDAPAPDGSGPYCAACDVRFSCREAWTRHVLISPKHASDHQVRNGCRDCGDSFATEKELRAHRRSLHRRQKVGEAARKGAPASGYPVKCSLCPEVMESARRYWQHFRREHPTDQYPSNNPAICEYCGKGFKCKSVLAYHRNTHEGKRSYACTLCPKAFFTPQNLENHLKSHSDSRPYVCDVCRKGFKFSVALLRHSRIHTGEKPYVCDVCGKGFTDSSGRKVHVRTVHLKEPTPYVSKARLERRRQSEAVKVIRD